MGDLYPQGVIGLGLKRFLGMPYLAYCHGEDFTQLDQYRFQPMVRDRIYREADAVVPTWARSIAGRPAYLSVRSTPW